MKRSERKIPVLLTRGIFKHYDKKEKEKKSCRQYKCNEARSGYYRTVEAVLKV